MRRIVALVLATMAMLAASIAAAESSVPPLAIAVNAPTSWSDSNGAVSGYLGLGTKHGIRVNAATYRYTDRGDAFLAALSANGIETEYSGRIRDLSIGWQRFSRGLWDGFSFEVDALVRSSEKRLDESFWNSRIHGDAPCHSRGRHESCTLRKTRSGCGIRMVARPSWLVRPVMPSGEPFGFVG